MVRVEDILIGLESNGRKEYYGKNCVHRPFVAGVMPLTKGAAPGLPSLITHSQTKQLCIVLR